MAHECGVESALDEWRQARLQVSKVLAVEPGDVDAARALPLFRFPELARDLFVPGYANTASLVQVDIDAQLVTKLGGNAREVLKAGQTQLAERARCTSLSRRRENPGEQHMRLAAGLIAVDNNDAQ